MIETDWLCIELTHTRGWRPRDRSGDELADYSALVRWGEAHGALSREEAKRLRRAAGESPRQAKRALGRVRKLREATYRVLAAAARGEAAADSELERLNGFLSQANRHRRLVASSGGYEWGWEDDAREDFDRILWAAARSAGELLTSGQLERVKLCDADDCGWIFIDASRNRSRRWCDMSDCGNRAKARRFRKRQRGE